MTYLSILLFVVFLTETISFTLNSLPNYRRLDAKRDARMRNFRNGDVCRSSLGLGHGQDNTQQDNTQDEGDDDEGEEIPLGHNTVGYRLYQTKYRTLQGLSHLY